MRKFLRIYLFVIISVLICLSYGEESSEDDEIEYKWPTIGITILVRNKAHSLPHFLSLLGRLDYPKDRLYLWIYADYNEDDSVEIIDAWAEKFGSEYNGIYMTVNTTNGPWHSDERGVAHWSENRMKHVINLRQNGLEFARFNWADYIFMLDADVFLTNPNTLKYLVLKGLPVVAPMLVSDGVHSNFWGGVTKGYKYKLTDLYERLIKHEEVGCFTVPLVHSAVLMSMRTKNSELLTYDPSLMEDFGGPEDDIVTLAMSAKRNGMNSTVCNDRLYGFIAAPLSEIAVLADDYHQVANARLEALGRGIDFPLEDLLKKYVYVPEKNKLGLDEVYVINLERRTERRMLMDKSLEILGIDGKFVKAVDGKTLDPNNLKKVSVTLMPGYEDPYYKRPMKTGEIGCFLSHFMVWKEIAQKHHTISLVLEDDVHFTPYFNKQFFRLLDELNNMDFDFVYIGRKILQNGKENYFTTHTTKPLYSYWSIGYIITEQGARKLIKAEPLSKMLPVDEFLPIMFDKHPNSTWKAFFPVRDLKALSAAPLLIHPTHYTGQPGYISDTEDSDVLAQEAQQESKTVWQTAITFEKVKEPNKISTFETIFNLVQKLIVFKIVYECLSVLFDHIFGED